MEHNRSMRIPRFWAVAGAFCLAVAHTLFLLPAGKNDAGAGAEIAYAAERRHVTATWMWNTDRIWGEKEKTLDSLEQKGVNLLYLLIAEGIPADVYSAFIREAGERGIEVHALGGAPNWVLPEHNEKLYKFIDWVKSYNNNVLPAERFKGIHLDVEPYVLPQWRTEQDALLGLWMDTVSGFVEEVKADSSITVGASLPVWLDGFRVRDGYGGRTTLSDWMIRRLDQITLMAYRDNAKDILASVADELELAEKAGKPVVVGVETLNNGEPNTSFYPLGRAYMMRELDTVIRTLSGKSSFAGHAVHEMEGWSALKD